MSVHALPETDRSRAGIHPALAELPECERALIELAYWSGLSQAEVALRLNIPRWAVQARLRSALRRLVDVLERDDAASA